MLTAKCESIPCRLSPYVFIFVVRGESLGTRPVGNICQVHISLVPRLELQFLSNLSNLITVYSLGLADKPEDFQYTEKQPMAVLTVAVLYNVPEQMGN